MNTNDFLGLGKVLPIDKLIDVISKSVGKLSKSYFDRKDVDTKAYEIEKIAEARAKEIKIIATAVKENFEITGGIEYKDEKISINSPEDSLAEIPHTSLITPSLEERTQERLNFQEAKKQLNIETITAFAADELKNENPVTDEPLDEDWITRFFKNAEEISNEEMQALWGKILAGEIKQPKSYSLRTLELIRNLSKYEADIFIKVADFATKTNNVNLIFKNEDEILDKFNISYNDIALLIEIGLIQAGEFLEYNIHQKPVDSQAVFTSGNVIMIAKIKANSPQINIPVYSYTKVGNELLKLVKTKVSLDYLKMVANSIKSENVDIKYAYILSIDETNISHTMPLQEFR